MGDGPVLWSPPAAREFDVVGLGENSLDSAVRVERLPALDETVDLVNWTTRPGGQVATALLGCSRLGLRTGFVSSVGDDSAAEPVLAPLREAKVDLSGVRVVEGAATRVALILVERSSGERAILGRRDSRLDLEVARLDRSEITRARLLHLDASDPDACEWAAKVARDSGIPVVLDADRSWPQRERLLARVDFPVVGRRFAEELGGTGLVRDGLAALVALGVRLAVVTLGESGALARDEKDEYSSPAFRVPVTDTTGAGDAFHAGFIWGLFRELGTRRLLQAANAVAGLSCRADGAQGGLPEVAEVERLLAEGVLQPWRDPDEPGRGPEDREDQ